MQLSGGVAATSDGTEVTNIAFDVTLAAGGEAVNWTPSATTNRTIVAYVDNSVQVDSMTYTTTVITGDSDNLLEPGELFEINLTNVGAVAGIDINANEQFTLEVQPPSGSYMGGRMGAPGPHMPQGGRMRHRDIIGRPAHAGHASLTGGRDSAATYNRTTHTPPARIERRGARG
jgi:hypothetical protein